MVIIVILLSKYLNRKRSNGDIIDSLKYNKNTGYVNMSGVYGQDPFDSFGNVWTDRDLKLIRALLIRLNEHCKKVDTKCILMYGSLLGWARHNKRVIPWDDDMDVAIFRKDAERLVESLKSDPELIIGTESSDYYDLKISWKDQGLPIKHFSYRYPFIDLFWCDFEDSQLRIDKVKNIFELDVDVFETRQDTFEDVQIHVPVDYRIILDTLYPNWKYDCVSSGWNHRLEYRVDDRYKQKIKCELL